METPLTKPFADLVRKRVQRDPEFGHLIFLRAIEYFSKGDLVMGSEMLHGYIDATVGYDKLGKALGKSPTGLRWMLMDDRNIRGDDLAATIEYLKRSEGLEVKVSCATPRPERKSGRKAAKEAAAA